MQQAAPRKDFRNATRLGVAMSAQLREHGGGRFEVTVLDLSQTGFRCETFYGLAIGSRVFLTIPSLSAREANVAWKDGFTYGCNFTQPLHIAVFEAMAARFPDS